MQKHTEFAALKEDCSLKYHPEILIEGLKTDYLNEGKLNCKVYLEFISVCFCVSCVPSYKLT